MKKNHFIVLLAFIVLFVFSTCDLEKGFFFNEEKFNSEWNKWNDADIQNYSFTLNGKLPHWNFSRAILMFEYEVNIIVKNGQMESFEYIGNIPHNEENEESILEPEFTSISDMYQKISDRAKKEKDWWKNDSGNGGFVSTTYNIKYAPQLHYITFFEPVIEVESGWILDTTNHAVRISNFIVHDSE